MSSEQQTFSQLTAFLCLIAPGFSVSRLNCYRSSGLGFDSGWGAAT